VRILLVTSRPPWPPRRGDQARTAGLAARLVERHHLAVVSVHPAGFPAAAPPAGVTVVNVATGRLAQALAVAAHPALPAQVAMHSLPLLRAQVGRTAAEFRPDVVLLVLSRLGSLLPTLRGLPVVVDFIDSLALNMRQRASRQPLLAPFLRLEARRMEAWDRRVLQRVVGGVVVSQRDREAMASADPSLAQRLAVVPFGVPVGERPPTPRPQRGVVLLSGNLGYFPTVDGARWFARQVWPRIRAAAPLAVWWLAGARPPRSLRKLGRLPGVSVTANPPDLAPLLAAATVAVAPLRSGSGTPIKVLEAMAAGVPVVTTPWAAAGLDDVPAEAVAVAADAETFAACVARLLADPALAHRQAVAAWEWLRATHALPSASAAFEEILVQAARR